MPSISSSYRSVMPRRPVTALSMRSSMLRPTGPHMQGFKRPNMENKEHLIPNVPLRNLAVRSGRVFPELNSFGESGNPYLFETGGRPEGSEGLLGYWRILTRHKIAILAASFGGLLLGFLIGIPLKPVFRASTTLEVLNVNEDFMNM